MALWNKSVAKVDRILDDGRAEKVGWTARTASLRSVAMSTQADVSWRAADSWHNMGLGTVCVY